MPHWLIKSALHRVIGSLPYRQRWNAIFQKLGTRSLALHPGIFELRVAQCRQHLDHFFEFARNRDEEFTVLELGTGWFPTLAIGMYLSGAKELWTYDIDPLLHSGRLKLLLNYFCDYERRGALTKLLPHARKDRVAKLAQLAANTAQESPEQILEHLNIHVFVRDAQDTGLRAGSIDFLFSHGVLEYIPRSILAGILGEFSRVAKSAAVMSHYIDLTDQYHYFDRTIGPLNFLKYSSHQWKYLNSPLMWQSRLRLSDYDSLLKAAGWSVVHHINTCASDKDLDNLSPASEFQNYAVADLSVLKSWVAATKTNYSPSSHS